MDATRKSMPGMPPAQGRVIAYIDGFNLYHGLKAADWRRFLWLDLVALARSLIRANQRLVEVKYFTTRVTGSEGRKKRQATYLEALECHCGEALKMYFGRFQFDPWKCPSCTEVQQVLSEKKTDVNIAVEIMTDAFQGLFDTALLVTGDSDLVPAVLAIKRLFPDKRIVVAFPPERESFELQQHAHTFFTIGRAKFSKAQMPDAVNKPDETKVSRPEKWRSSPTAFGQKLEAALGE